MKPLIALMVSVLLTLAVGGTQAPVSLNMLILDDKEEPLFAYPVDPLWVDELGVAIPFFLPIAKEPEGHFEQQSLDGSIAPQLGTSGLRKRTQWSFSPLVATWRLDRDRLVLVKVEQERWKTPPLADKEKGNEGRPQKEMRAIPIGQALPGKTLPLFAEWFSGRLRISDYKGRFCLDTDQDPRSERDTFLEFKNGVLVSRVAIDNTGKNLYRTEYARPWKTYGDEGGTDWSWIDPRLFGYGWIEPLQHSGEVFRTRGGFSRQPPSDGTRLLNLEKAKAALLVYETPDQSRRVILLHGLPAGVPPADGALVEIECRFVKNGERQELHVSSIRELKPSEALFHTDFPEFIEKRQTEMRAEWERKAAAAKKAAAPAKAE